MTLEKIQQYFFSIFLFFPIYREKLLISFVLVILYVQILDINTYNHINKLKKITNLKYKQFQFNFYVIGICLREVMFESFQYYILFK